LVAGMLEFGLHSEALDKSRMDEPIRKALLKDNSISNQLNLSFVRGWRQKRPSSWKSTSIRQQDPGLVVPHCDYEVCHQDGKQPVPETAPCYAGLSERPRLV
jgi:hypothetical protein